MAARRVRSSRAGACAAAVAVLAICLARSDGGTAAPPTRDDDDGADVVLTDLGTEGEGGLTSIAFDPGYAHNRRPYAFYSNSEGNVAASQLRRSKGSNLQTTKGLDVTRPPRGAIEPIYQYTHEGADVGPFGEFSGCAVVGGVVVRDRRLPDLAGRYRFSDVCDAQIRSLLPDDAEASEASTGLSVELPSSITAGRRGRVYLTDLSAGHVYRLDPAPGEDARIGASGHMHRLEAAHVAGTAARIGDGRGGFRAASVGTFDEPTYVTGPRGAGGLLFVVEQRGTIKIVRNGKRAGTFLDIRKRVESGGERGLLSVAFPPDYGRRGRFYVYYTRPGGDIVIQEYRRAGDNQRRARAGSARTVLVVEHSANPNHNGGQLQFGPDGLLYAGTGDGGSAYDPPENAQSKDSLLGKLLRIDPERKGGKRYTVPRSNPFVGGGGRAEIYSYGLRNPFRFSFDRRGGALAIGDVGQDRYEEVDFTSPRDARGANFGWDAFEGNHPLQTDASSPPPDPVFPIFEYDHDDGNCAITGGYVARDKRIPSLFGRYLYADYCRGQIRSLVPSRGGASGDLPTGLPSAAGISSFGEDGAGRLYYASSATGEVVAIRPLKKR